MFGSFRQSLWFDLQLTSSFLCSFEYRSLSVRSVEQRSLAAFSACFVSNYRSLALLPHSGTRSLQAHIQTITGKISGFRLKSSEILILGYLSVFLGQFRYFWHSLNYHSWLTLTRWKSAFLWACSSFSEACLSSLAFRCFDPRTYSKARQILS